MATYPVINKETGEQKEVIMSVHAWDQWKEDNPDWERDYSDPSTMPAMGVESVGDFQDKLSKKHPSWNEVLKKADKAGGINARLAKRNINTTQEYDSSFDAPKKSK